MLTSSIKIYHLKLKLGFLTYLFALLAASNSLALTPDEIPKKVIESIVQICAEDIGCGTGAVLDDGRVVTALHVVSAGCWSGYCDNYTIQTSSEIGSRAQSVLIARGLRVEKVLPGLDIAILSASQPKPGVFSLNDIVALEGRKLYTLDFANGGVLRFDEGHLVENRVTYATSTIHGGKGSSGAPVFDSKFRLAGIRVSSASWKDAVRGMMLPYSKGALTPADIISKASRGPTALRIAQGLNAHHQILRECPLKKCTEARGFFVGNVADLAFFLGELNEDLNLNRPSWYTIFSFFGSAAPGDELGKELELLSLSYEIELHIGQLSDSRKEQILQRIEELLERHPREPKHRERIDLLLKYARSGRWPKHSFSVPEFSNEIISALALPLSIWSIVIAIIGFLFGLLLAAPIWRAVSR